MAGSNDFTIEYLGKRNVQSPIIMSTIKGDHAANYVTDDEYIRLGSDVTPGPQAPLKKSQVLEKAGPREMIYFAPANVHAGIVTCGGLCPGLNDVIRALVRNLWYRYGVRRISGIQFGYLGFLPEHQYGVKPLSPENVDTIHKLGGTLLGSARGGGQETSKIVDTLEQLNMNMLFTIGGDGTQKGALAVAEEIERRKLKIAVVGIPKTVDNDFILIQKSFGFDTAVDKAVETIDAAHTEAISAINGIGLVKLMGREAGFIAVHTALASHDVNFVLIPEVPFDLDGPNGFLTHLEQRMARRNHAVIVVAEGAMQDQLQTERKLDAGGNLRLADVGTYLRDQINKYFADKKIEINLKYIDPSYIIRSAPANPADSIYCERLGNAAAHAAMAGKTKLIIGLVNNEFAHLPINTVVAQRNLVDPEGNLWRDTLDATLQPTLMVN